MIAFLAGLLVGAGLGAIGVPLIRGVMLWREVRADDADTPEMAVLARVIELDRSADAAGH